MESRGVSDWRHVDIIGVSCVFIGSPSSFIVLFLSSCHLGNDHCSSMCTSRRGTQPSHPPIHSPLQYFVSTHTVRTQPQTDLQSEDPFIHMYCRLYNRH